MRVSQPPAVYSYLQKLQFRGPPLLSVLIPLAVPRAGFGQRRNRGLSERPLQLLAATTHSSVKPRRILGSPWKLRLWHPNVVARRAAAQWSQTGSFPVSSAILALFNCCDGSLGRRAGGPASRTTLNAAAQLVNSHLYSPGAGTANATLWALPVTRCAAIGDNSF